MKENIFNLANVTALAFLHLLMELWRALLDFSLVLPQFAESTGELALYGLGYVLVFGTWLLGIRSAGKGKRSGNFVALAIGALFWVGVDWGTIFVFCPGGCEDPVFDYTSYLNILIGGLTLAGWVVNLIGPRSSTT